MSDSDHDKQRLAKAKSHVKLALAELDAIRDNNVDRALFEVRNDLMLNRDTMGWLIYSYKHVAT